MSLLSIKDLDISFSGYGQQRQVLHGVGFDIAKGERLSVIGETGSGKSVTAKAILGTLPGNARVDGGTIHFDGLNLAELSEAARTRMKGTAFSIIMQDPLSSFNPVFRIGRHLEDVLYHADRRIGRLSSERDRYGRILETLRRVQLSDAERIYEAWPFELSGGMRQRVLIALALLHRPRLLIADEPGTALDVTTQAEILRLINQLVDEEGLSLLMITHNLGVVRQMSDRVVVMEHGHVVEQGRLGAVFANPSQPYTRSLMEAVPPLYGDGVQNQKPQGETPIVQLEDVGKTFVKRHGLGRRSRFQAVKGVTLQVNEGDIFGLAGESGSGKTTVARMIMGLIDPTEGAITITGEKQAGAVRLSQMVYQNPGSSLNPKRTVAQTLSVPLRQMGLGADARQKRMAELLALVRLPVEFVSKYPHELSGGQKQRIAIARALAAEPRILVLDEPTSALDVSVQKTVIDLLLDLRARLGLTYVIISHDLSLMRNFCTRLAIMQQGKVIEEGTPAEVFAAARHSYTRVLISAIPVLSAAEEQAKPSISDEERARFVVRAPAA